MRLFLAIELPGAPRKHLAAVQNALRAHAPEAAWTRSENLHLSLKFLGEVPDPQVPSLCDALRLLAESPPLSMAVTGLLCFPPGGRIRIVGAEVDGGEALLSVQSQIEDACQKLGFRRDGRPYRPHITLARARLPLPPALRGQFAEALASHLPGPPIPVNQVTLMQSKLHPSGAVYTPAAHFRLHPATGPTPDDA